MATVVPTAMLLIFCRLGQEEEEEEECTVEQRMKVATIRRTTTIDSCHCDTRPLHIIARYHHLRSVVLVVVAMLVDSSSSSSTTAPPDTDPCPVTLTTNTSRRTVPLLIINSSPNCSNQSRWQGHLLRLLQLPATMAATMRPCTVSLVSKSDPNQLLLLNKCSQSS